MDLKMTCELAKAAMLRFKRIATKSIGIFFAVYFAGTFFLAVPYFNWRYAQENGFWSWILLGELRATFNVTPAYYAG